MIIGIGQTSNLPTEVIAAELQTEVWVDGLKLKRVKFTERCDIGNGTCRKVSVEDKKVHKRVPEGKFVSIVIKIPKTGQVSPAFSYKRKKKDSNP
ncbi:MAG TPA: hypothetical protein VKC34_01155 [Blastocatellia bacterium]|nr:hypothetical protein [Blastocatellia bacterium]